jgi:hemerythrin-like domain-containing protein
LIQELAAEHTEPHTKTRKSRKTVKLLESGVISRKEIKKQLSAFLIQQRQHMYIEEEKRHPLIESV